MCTSTVRTFSTPTIRPVWDYVTKFAEFNRFTNSPVANYHGELYSLPFNMYTFNKDVGGCDPSGGCGQDRGAAEGRRYYRA